MINLTWNFNVFAVTLFLDVKTPKSALGCSVPQFLIRRIILKARDHDFVIALQYLRVLLTQINISG